MSMTTTKRDALYVRLAGNPEFNAADATYMKELITRSGDFILAYCSLPEYPELSQGYSQSGASPSEDLTALTTNKLSVSVNGSDWQVVEPTLANCDSGANAAAELQSVVRAVGTDNTSLAGFDEVTVAFASSLYTLTSGRYGEYSAINIAFEGVTKQIAEALKLTPQYGGVEVPGGETDTDVDTACLMLAESLYSKAGLEGIKSGSVPGGISFTEHDLDPRVRSILMARRRLW